MDASQLHPGVAPFPVALCENISSGLREPREAEQLLRALGT